LIWHAVLLYSDAFDPQQLLVALPYTSSVKYLAMGKMQNDIVDALSYFMQCNNATIK